MDGKLQILIYHLNADRFGLRLSQVERVVRAVECTPLPKAPEMVRGVIDLQGKVVPVLDLRKKFGLCERGIGIEDHFIIALASKRTVALVVDSVTDVIEHPADDVVAASKILSNIEHIEGVVQLEDGLTLIHDLDRFLSLDDEQAFEQALARRPAHGN